MAAIQLLGAATGWGAKRRETADGPKNLVSKLGRFEILAAPTSTDQASPHTAWLEVRAFNERLSREVGSHLRLGHFPIVIGGDHAIAMGTWWGVVRARSCVESFGLIWIDAHMDGHTPATSPSQAMHGMPVAGLLGYGPEAWGKGLVPALRPSDIVLIGVRSFEEGEAALLEELGVTIYTMADVQKEGFSAILTRAHAQVTQHTHAFGLSIDLDAFDPIEVPGVGSPEPNGLHVTEVLPALEKIFSDPQLAALEIVEYNPGRDVEDKTGLLVEKIVYLCKGARSDGNEHNRMD